MKGLWRRRKPRLPRVPVVAKVEQPCQTRRRRRRVGYVGTLGTTGYSNSDTPPHSRPGRKRPAESGKRADYVWPQRWKDPKEPQGPRSPETKSKRKAKEKWKPRDKRTPKRLPTKSISWKSKSKPNQLPNNQLAPPHNSRTKAAST